MLRIFSYFGFIVLLFSACDKASNNNTQNHDRGQMLSYYYDQQIQPAFDSLNFYSEQLQVEFSKLPETILSSDLNKLRFTWYQIFESWQKASIFNLGPSGENGLRKSMVQELGTFPISLSKINQYVSKQDTSFSNFDRDSRGLFAIEYFLFGGNELEVLSHINQINERLYLKALINHFHGEINRINRAWGEYKNNFVSNIGTDAGSSTVILYNSFLMCYENLKNYKLGVPLGLRMGQTQKEPEKVEALYSEQGLKGIKLQFNALKNVWQGTSTLGFKNYLLNSTGGKELVELTETQLLNIQTKIDACPELPMHLGIQTHTKEFVELHTELQRNTRFFKSDMSSILGLTITYSSSDGD